MSIEHLTMQLDYCRGVVMRNVEGIGDEESLAGPAGGGNCINWVLGHILVARSGLLKMLGGEPVVTPGEAAPYERGSSPLAADAALPLTELLGRYSATQQDVLAALAACSAERLAEKAPFSPRNDPGETVGSLLSGLVFHESYHAGQLGVLRRALGRDGAIS